MNTVNDATDVKTAKPASAITRGLDRAQDALLGLMAGSAFDKILAALSFGVGVLALGWSVYTLIVVQDDDPLSVALLFGLSLVLLLLGVNHFRRTRTWDVKVVVLALLALGCGLVLNQAPQFITGLQLNMVMDRSVLAFVFLLGLALPTLGASLYYLLGQTPHAEDMAQYPLVVLPVLLVVGLYLVLLQQMLWRGLLNFDWNIISVSYFLRGLQTKIMVAGDWPMWTTVQKEQTGMLNHLLGTGQLMLLTSLISLPIGVGTGIFLSEYGSGRLAGAARFVIYSLRAISVLILGMTAYSLAQLGNGTALAALLHGTYFDGAETIVASNGGSFLIASIAMSFLVVPVIARATEDGCRALPADLREGSLALGASDETTQRRLVVPWALPNIVTSLLLGCIEAAGSVAVILFVAGRGEEGVGPFNQVTSLAFMIFDAAFGDKYFIGRMGPYQYTAGVLLLIITLGLGLMAMGLKRFLVWRYRGG